MNTNKNIPNNTTTQNEREAELLAIVEQLIPQSRANGGTPPATPEDFIAGLNLIAEFFLAGEPTAERTEQVLALAKLLAADFKEFGSAYFETRYRDTEFFKRFSELHKSEKVTKSTSFEELQTLMDVGPIQAA